jgi:CelD/BcsL family acetyltransferase involved in cellulose biosynthesis
MTPTAGSAPSERLALAVTCAEAFDDDLAQQWDALLPHAPTNTVFLTSAWLRAWHVTLGQHQPLIIPQVRIGGRLVAAAAFVASDGVVEFAGRGPSDYLDIVLDTSVDERTRGRAIGALLKTAKSATPHFRHFRLDRIQPESATASAIAASQPRFIATFTGEPIPAPYLDLNFVAERLKKKSLNRDERALMRRGDLACNTMTRAADILPCLDAFFEQHIARWRSVGVQSLFLQPEARAFYRELTQRLDQTGALLFTTMHLDGKLVAAHFGFLYADRFFLYKPTFDTALPKLSPGKVLVKRLLELARDRNAGTFDFTIGDEAYKHWFASGVRQIRSLHVTDSKAAAAVRRSRACLGRTTRALVDRWRRA